MQPYFNINEDLEGRKLTEKIEILWISGPTYHDAELISKILNLPVDQIKATGEHAELVRKFLQLGRRNIRIALKQRASLKPEVVKAYEEALAELRARA
jgi:hypothetical protein